PEEIQPEDWEAEAFNQVPESENRIHSDDTARRFGFKGGLVPGVTVSAYLCHPAIQAWGREWIERGSARVVVHTPLYDHSNFRVEIRNRSARSYDADLIDSENRHCAECSAELPDHAPASAEMRGDPRADQDGDRPLASRDVMESLRKSGMRAMPARWSPDSAMLSYLRDPAQMPELFRPNGGGFANPAFVLGLTNWALAANVRMPAWLHLQTHSQNYGSIPPESELLVESEIVDLFAKRGHEFVDLDVVTYLQPEDRAVTKTRLRAIYQLRSS
ncbi:MAG: hypothetical protein GY725_20530, partial [bacterium]|nr:hypothetical protein [bacterium]